MGSLAYALGGALAGGGAGAAAVGAEATNAIVKEGIERLRNNYENERQQVAIQAQKNLQAQSETFTHSESEIAAQRAIAAAAATREYEAREKAADRATREKVGAGHDTARLDAAAVAAYQRSSTAAGKNTIKPFQSKTMKVADPRNPLSPPVDRAYTYDPNTGISYVQVGNRHYRMNGQTGEPIDGRTGAVYNPATRRRGDDADVSPAEVQAVTATPYEKVPSGYKNAGMTYIEAFEAEHGYVPSQIVGNVGRLSQQQQQQSASQSSSIKLPSGRVLNVPAGMTLGGGGSTAGGVNAQDLRNDNDDDQE